MIIATRSFNDIKDTGIIMETMPKSVYYDTHKGPPNKQWFIEYFQYLQPLLKRAFITIACDKDDHDFILGYSIVDPEHMRLEFVYVKDAYRKQNIATLLGYKNYEEFNYKNITKLGRQILDQNYKKIIGNKPKEESMAKKQAPSQTNKTDQIIQDDQAVSQEQYTEMTSHINPKQLNNYEALKLSGFEIKKVTFLQAVLSGFNSAENQLDVSSGNKSRVPSKLIYTSGGVIVEQNGHEFIVPLANVGQGDLR